MFILTYHSQNISPPGAGPNDHASLAADLEALHAAGVRFRALAELLDWFDAGATPPDRTGVVLTFDDGCDFDVRDLEWPGAGLQRSFLGIMEDFRERHGASAQPGLHATSYVIASPEARETIDARSLFGTGLISDDWWAEAVAHPMLDIGNHGWDHNHPDLGPGRGGFTGIQDDADCHRQVIEAARTIEQRAGRWPDTFAYPFGESSTALREHWFPARQADHRCRAALGTDPGRVHAGSDRWNLPRLVCGRDWADPDSLLQRLASP